MTAFTLAILLVSLTIISCATSQADRNIARARMNTGIAYIQSNEFTPALKELMEAEKTDPDNPDIQYYLGICYYRKGLENSAVASLEKAITLNADYSEAHNFLGTIYLKNEDYEKAAREFGLALRNVLYDTPELSLNNLGWTYYKMGRFKDALATYKKAMDVQPNRLLPAIHMNTAILYREENNIHMAINHLKKSTELAPYVSEYHYLLGSYYLESGNKRRGLEELRLAISSNPASPSAARSRELIRSLSLK